jgi:trans-aconitate methyltransferase
MNLCHVCGQVLLKLSPDYPKFKRVTSDCKPWPKGGQLGVCEACRCVQAMTNDAWREEITNIYRAYEIYHHGGGKEQHVFEQSSGAASSRSDRLVSMLATLPVHPLSGRLMDIGCGNGAFLTSFGRAFPNWEMEGLEWDDKYRSPVESIPGVKNLYSGDVSLVPGNFDAISMIHVLEHIESPLSLLQKVKKKLTPGGLLIIQLPYFVENPFELFVADHATHFDRVTVRSLLEQAGFQVSVVETTWVSKELSIVAYNLPPKASSESAHASPQLSSILNWLKSVIDRAQAVASESKNFGIFGTSIAGTWLFNEIGSSVRFFVDEDTNRIGRHYLGLPVLHPTEVPAESDVYVGLAPMISSSVVRRIQSKGARYHEVPQFPPFVQPPFISSTHGE